VLRSSSHVLCPTCDSRHGGVSRADEPPPGRDWHGRTSPSRRRYAFGCRRTDQSAQPCTDERAHVWGWFDRPLGGLDAIVGRWLRADLVIGARTGDRVSWPY
jgi:hypothetical protein